MFGGKTFSYSTCSNFKHFFVKIHLKGVISKKQQIGLYRCHFSGKTSSVVGKTSFSCILSPLTITDFMAVESYKYCNKHSKPYLHQIRSPPTFFIPLLHVSWVTIPIFNHLHKKTKKFYYLHQIKINKKRCHCLWDENQNSSTLIITNLSPC